MLATLLMSPILHFFLEMSEFQPRELLQQAGALPTQPPIFLTQLPFSLTQLPFSLVLATISLVLATHLPLLSHPSPSTQPPVSLAQQPISLWTLTNKFKSNQNIFFPQLEKPKFFSSYHSPDFWRKPFHAAVPLRCELKVARRRVFLATGGQ